MESNVMLARCCLRKCMSKALLCLPNKEENWVNRIRRKTVWRSGRLKLGKVRVIADGNANSESISGTDLQEGCLSDGLYFLYVSPSKTLRI
ncbi:hypothetical protein ZHAS_00021679 [Anopheles sinensis]|uniref:Uncharacterized protein n=1 Tax=Anopheles sinensis TaxID=74873 RepID=A0A084WT23_ANOSI|nr:hypothetical protein ZHAS_00021679 [Anopheles sinensis]